MRNVEELWLMDNWMSQPEWMDLSFNLDVMLGSHKSPLESSAVIYLHQFCGKYVLWSPFSALSRK